MKNISNIAIIGGGASGLFCAIVIKQFNPSVNVTIYEGQNKVGKKILQTGNGKCNLCNINLSIDNYNTNKLQQLIDSFSAYDLMNIFQNWGLMTKVDEDGRVYPYSERATTVLDILLKKIEELDIKVITSCYISKVEKHLSDYSLYTKDNKKYNCDYLIVSTGGASSINYVNNGYKLLQSLGHTKKELQPSLCALKTKENTKHLSGVRVKCKASIIIDNEIKHETRGEILFKDDGLSGIAIFILSQYYQKNKKCFISLDLYENKTIQQLNEELYKNANLEMSLLGYFPKMINLDLAKKCSKTIGHIIKDYRFEIVDTYNFNNSQVTKGGISLEEINLTNFESLKASNLYIIGEILDVDGTCGGYNLYFAFASAYKVALDLSKKIGD